MAAEKQESPRETPAQDVGTRLVTWIQNNGRTVTAGVVGIAIVAVSVWFVTEYQRRKAQQAGVALDNARVAVQSGNLPLAASDLTRLIATYRGTSASDEAVLLLGRVRLEQDQPSVAAEELQGALGRGLSAEFRAPIEALLGAALENLGDHTQAGQAYENAASTTWYDFVAAQYLLDAGRAYSAAGDTIRAIEVYERVIAEHKEAPAEREARLRLAELKARAGIRS